MSCLTTKLSRINLTPLDSRTPNVGMVSLGVEYSVKIGGQAGAYEYIVNVHYPDSENS